MISQFPHSRQGTVDTMPCFLWLPKRTENSGGYFQKNWVVCGMIPETLTRFQTKICDFLCPYFRPDQKFDTLFQPCLKKFDTLFQTWSPRAWRAAECMTSFYGTYTVVGVNIKREMVLSPNDEEVANSSKTHTQFNTRRHKPYPVSDQNSRNWYPVSNQKG